MAVATDPLGLGGDGDFALTGGPPNAAAILSMALAAGGADAPAILTFGIAFTGSPGLVLDEAGPVCDEASMALSSSA